MPFFAVSAASMTEHFLRGVFFDTGSLIKSMSLRLGIVSFVGMISPNKYEKLNIQPITKSNKFKATKMSRKDTLFYGLAL